VFYSLINRKNERRFRSRTSPRWGNTGGPLGNQPLFSDPHGRTSCDAAEQHNLAEAITELREMAGGRSDILAVGRGITFGRARAQTRLPPDLRRQLLDAIYAGKPFRTTIRDLGLTPNQVWGTR
jgi:hypothetical protein